MEQTKYTKNQLVEVFETYRKSTEIFNDICRCIESVVENAVNAGVEKAKGIQFMKDEVGSFLTLKNPVSIISPVFKSFIDLYFVDDRRLATIYEAEDFTISEEDGFITVRAGETLLARIDPKTETE